MQAVVITPGERGSARLKEIPTPAPVSGEVLVKVLEVGIDGTDREIGEGFYGVAPPGDDCLVLGHESLGRVVETGELVVATVRRPCDEQCPNCRRGRSDMCSTGGYRERGIRQLHGYMAGYFAERPEYLITIPESLRHVAVLLEPMSIVEKAISQAFQIQLRLAWEPRFALVLGAGPIGLLATMLLRSMGIETSTLDRVSAGGEKAAIVRETGATYVQSWPERAADLIVEATGHPPFTFEAMERLAINGVLALVGVSGGQQNVEIPAARITFQLVLGNRLVFGIVNSNSEHFRKGLEHLGVFESRWPGLLSRVVTRRLPLARFSEGLAAEPGIKTVLEVGQ